MVYVADLDKVYDEVKIAGFHLGSYSIELKEISGCYFIVSTKDKEVTIGDYSDLKLALDVYHKLIETHTISDLH